MSHEVAYMKRKPCNTYQPFKLHCIMFVSFTLLACSLMLFIYFEILSNKGGYTSAKDNQHFSANLSNQLISNYFADVDIKHLLDDTFQRESFRTENIDTIQKLRQIRVHNALRGFNSYQSEKMAPQTLNQQNPIPVQLTLEFDQASDLQKIKQRVLKWEESSN